MYAQIIAFIIVLLLCGSAEAFTIKAGGSNFASPPAIGNTTPATGKFTTLTTTGHETVNGSLLPALESCGAFPGGANDNFANWTVQSNAVLTANQAASPYGFTTAASLSVTTDALSSGKKTITTSAGATTFSVYVRSQTGTAKFTLAAYTATIGFHQSADFTATTSWQRFTFTYTTAAEGTNFYVMNDLASEAADLYIWGAKVEAGSTATAFSPSSTATLATGSSDTAGIITVGTGTVTSCGLGFATSYTNTPSCTCTMGGMGSSATCDIASQTTTGIAFRTSADSNGKYINYHCIGVGE